MSDKIGIVFTQDQKLLGIDVDHCLSITSTRQGAGGVVLGPGTGRWVVSPGIVQVATRIEPCTMAIMITSRLRRERDQVTQPCPC